MVEEKEKRKKKKKKKRKKEKKKKSLSSTACLDLHARCSHQGKGFASSPGRRN